LAPVTSYAVEHLGHRVAQQLDIPVAPGTPTPGDIALLRYLLADSRARRG
jgi:hypothetical protein